MAIADYHASIHLDHVLNGGTVHGILRFMVHRPLLKLLLLLLKEQSSAFHVRLSQVRLLGRVEIEGLLRPRLVLLLQLILLPGALQGRDVNLRLAQYEGLLIRP